MAEKHKSTGSYALKDLGQHFSSQPAQKEMEKAQFEIPGDEYFEARNKGERPIVKEGLVTTKAEEVALKIGKEYSMTSHQLRRFFNHARLLERRLKYSESNFNELRSEIERLITFAIDASGKRKIPKSFENFIRTNVTLAIKSRDHFLKGFLPHFEAVVAYFSYHYPKK